MGLLSCATYNPYFQVNAAALYGLQKEAYQNCNQDDCLFSFDEWREMESQSKPQLKYWDIALLLELTVLQFVRVNREANFDLYLQALNRLVGLFFALDLGNYARWLPVHIRDLASLSKQHPYIAEQSKAGKFVARKSHKPFSAIALDQNHEQINARLKGDGGKHLARETRTGT